MLPYKSDGYTRRKIKIKPPRETNLGVVSFAALIRVVTQCSYLLTAASGEERCVTTLIAAAKETNLGVAAA